MEEGLMPHMETAPSLTLSLVRYVLGMADKGLAPEVRHKAALCMLDHFACCLPLRGLPWTEAVLRYSSRTSAPPQAHHWWLDHRIAATDAAFGNSLLGHWLIRDDMHVPSASHIGVVVVPAILALAQRERLSGRALLTGIVAGYEGMARAGMAVRSGAFNPHFRATGISGAYGAAAGAVAALRLDETVGVRALSFAANFASGLNEWSWSGGQEVYVHAGTAARNALIAVDLARAGITSSATILEGRDGMFAAYNSSPDAALIFLANLNEPCIQQVEFKPFAGCNYILTPVAAALDLREREDVKPAYIDSVTIRTFTAARTYPGCDCSGPFTGVVQAKMSLQYGVAAALLYGKVDEAAFTRFDDPALTELIARCHLENVETFDAAYPGRQPAEIVVVMANGQQKSAELNDVPWLSAEAVEQRFEDEASQHYNAETVQRIKQMALSLWETPDCRSLFDTLT
jgi:2-methylcitrate dehydratase PrpD